MRVVAAPHKTQPVRTEQIILFRTSTQIFAISSASVQEVRSVDSLAGVAVEVNEPTLVKVRHALRRGERNLYVVNAAVHFGLRPSPAALIFLIRRSRVALLVDGIEKMSRMSRLQALPGAFCHEERAWYRGVTVLDQSVIPVVSPAGFLTADEIALLDALSGSRSFTEIAGTTGADLTV
jgi:chemotaxis signal transduction protein